MNGRLWIRTLRIRGLGIRTLGLLAVFALAACEGAPEKVTLQGQTMGTYWRVTYLAEGAAPPDGRFRLASSFPRRVIERPEAADAYDATAAPPPLAAALEAVGLGGTAQLALMVEREGAGGVE